MKLYHQFILVGLLALIGLYLYWIEPEKGLSPAEKATAYQETLAQIDQKKRIFQKKYKEDRMLAIAETRAFVTDQLSQKIFPAWYGTPWAFHGTSQQPGQGKIACGYFVSGCLKDVGFKLPRAKMGQQAASVIIKSMAAKSSIQTYTKMADLHFYLKRASPGIFILGLDKHVGFIWKNEAEECFFIHSSGMYPRQVVQEPLAKSKSVLKSKIKMVGALGPNMALWQKWMHNERIKLAS